jgi:catechol 2,3-dioxygenase-like lactoylglutathione lyase family enzyme
MNVQAFDHVGIRVTDAKRALAFYASLAFVLDREYSDERVAEIISPSGVRLNLIFNGVETPGGRNVLLDEPRK